MKRCQGLAQLYDIYSLCMPTEFIFMSPVESAFVKYGVNSFLATKVTFFNQLYDSISRFGCNFPTVANAIGKDERIGIGHTRVTAMVNVDSVEHVSPKTQKHSQCSIMT